MKWNELYEMLNKTWSDYAKNAFPDSGLCIECLAFSDTGDKLDRPVFTSRWLKIPRQWNIAKSRPLDHCPEKYFKIRKKKSSQTRILTFRLMLIHTKMNHRLRYRFCAQLWNYPQKKRRHCVSYLGETKGSASVVIFRLWWCSYDKLINSLIITFKHLKRHFKMVLWFHYRYFIKYNLRVLVLISGLLVIYLISGILVIYLISGILVIYQITLEVLIPK